MSQGEIRLFKVKSQVCVTYNIEVGGVKNMKVCVTYNVQVGGVKKYDWGSQLEFHKRYML